MSIMFFVIFKILITNFFNMSLSDKNNISRRELKLISSLNYIIHINEIALMTS